MKKLYNIFMNKIMPLRRQTVVIAMPFVMAFMFCLLSNAKIMAQEVTVLSENFEHSGSMPSGWSMSFPSLEPL